MSDKNLQDEDMEYISSDTLESIVDGIFAVAMTILTFSIVVPDMGQLTAAGLPIYLEQLKSQIFLFIVCFIVLGNNWITQREILSLIEKTDKTLMIITLALLLGVSLYPIIITLVTNFGEEFPIFVQYYHLTNLYMGLILVLQWLYIVSKRLHLKISLDSSYIKNAKKLFNNDMSIRTSGFETFYYPIIIVISLVVSFWYPQPSRYLYILIIFKPVLNKINEKYYYRKVKEIVNKSPYINKISSKFEELPEDEKEYLKELGNNLNSFDSLEIEDRHRVIDILMELHPSLKGRIEEFENIKKENPDFDSDDTIEYCVKFKSLVDFYKSLDIDISKLRDD